jgi:hypothetical protein
VGAASNGMGHAAIGRDDVNVPLWGIYAA